MVAHRPGYRWEFLRSPHHAALGLLTLGIGFLTGQVFPFLVGAGAYALGWIYLPDMGFFRRWVDGRYDAAARAAAAAEVAEFVRRRDGLVQSLARSRRERYAEMADVCRDIERANEAVGAGDTDPGTDPRLRKLDELAWTFLRLLSFEQALEEFLETERREDLPRALEDARDEAGRLGRECAELKENGGGLPLQARERLLQSATERVAVLEKRIHRVQQARDNMALVSSEQERLVQQVKLVRADVVATRNADAFSTRIDASVEHLGETNRWLAEMEDFRDIVGDMPRTDLRVGYASVAEGPPSDEGGGQWGRRGRRREAN